MFLGFFYLFCFINHVHHFLDALQMLRYLHWVQISFILSCSPLFFSIVYHLHKMYLSCISFFQNLGRWLGNLVLQYDAPFFVCLFFLLKFDHITHDSPEKFKQRDVCVCVWVCVCIHIYMIICDLSQGIASSNYRAWKVQICTAAWRMETGSAKGVALVGRAADKDPD